jgi:hypothetical protein
MRFSRASVSESSGDLFPVDMILQESLISRVLFEIEKEIRRPNENNYLSPQLRLSVSLAIAR